MTSMLAVAAAASLASLAAASTLTPPVLPLFVRNPYLSAWLGNAREEPWERWPIFYTKQNIGFSVLASVAGDNEVYPLIGRAHDGLDRNSKHYNVSFPIYHGAQYDASTTNLSYTIPGPSQHSDDDVAITLSFLSPITPTSTLRQALPASYLTVHASGGSDVDVYIDLNGQWVTGDDRGDLVWSREEGEATDGQKLNTLRFRRRDEYLFTENRDRAEWGALLFTGPQNASFEVGASDEVRKRFAAKGALSNKVDSRFRSVMDHEPIFAFSQRLYLNSSRRSSHSGEDSALFTIAHVQNPVTQFASARGLTYMRPLWMSYFQTEAELVAFHYADYRHASALAGNYSAQVARDAYRSGSTNYKEIVELSARQVMGATSFSGTPDNPILFLKEISSNGNCQTVDVIFPSFPFFLYTNPRWLAYLLEPLIEHMLSGQYPNKYTMHDLGTHFPNMTGHPLGRDEYMPVEECGDMLIMGLALVNSLRHGSDYPAQSIWSTEGEAKDPLLVESASDEISPFRLPAQLETRDSIYGLDDQWGGSASEHQAKKWLSRSYPIWKQWTQYLVDFSLEPENQLCTDDFAGWLKLQTNLALKGIIGIRAMSKLAALIGDEKYAKSYYSISSNYISKWMDYGIARDSGRAKLAYHWMGSWTTLYSLYADAVLCFHPSANSSEASLPLLSAAGQLPLFDGLMSKDKDNFIPDSVYTTQSRWYDTVMQKYGLPLDSRHLYTKSDWEFQAAAVASRRTRKSILDRVARWLNETATDRPFTDLYKTEDDGGFPGPDFFARPVVGSHFAFLTLERACGGTGMGAFEYEE